MESTLRARSVRVRKKVHGFRAKSKSVLTSRRNKGRRQLVKV